MGQISSSCATNRGRFKAELAATCALSPEGEVLAYLGHARDISPRQRTEALLSRRGQILESIVRADPLVNILESIVSAAENSNADIICSVLLLDASGQRLNIGAAQSLPTVYREAIDGLTIGPDVSSCGSSAYWGKAVHVEDVMTDPAWEPFCELATQAGLRACWSEPVKAADGKVLGTFAVYHRQPRSPDPDDLDFMVAMTGLVTLALERDRDERSLREKHRSLELLSLTATSANQSPSITEFAVHMRDRGYEAVRFRAGPMERVRY